MTDPPNFREGKACLWCDHYDANREYCKKYNKENVNNWDVCDDYWEDIG